MFTERLGGVWKECHRVLKRSGLLVFTYHHSRQEGWRAVLTSLMKARFVIVRAHPIKAEMSVATPKHQAHEPIDLDMILVCRKVSRSVRPRYSKNTGALVRSAAKEAEAQLARLARVGRKVGDGDIRVVFMAQAIARLSHAHSVTAALRTFDRVEAAAAALKDRGAHMSRLRLVRRRS